MKKNNYGDILYKLLPEVYRKEDAERKHLKGFLDVTSVGFDYLNSKADGFGQVFDVDNTPAELLPHIAQMIGFEFPYEMTVLEQRGMIKIMPILYKLKGTQASFDYLSRQIFGVESKAFTEWQSRGGENQENSIRVVVEAEGNGGKIESKIERYVKYAELFRPVNHKIYCTILYNYSDFFDILNNIYDSNFMDVITMNETDELTFKKVEETFNDVSLETTADDFTNTLTDEIESSFIITPFELDTYKTMKDEHTDFTTDGRMLLNLGKLNSTLKLNRLAKETQI